MRKEATRYSRAVWTVLTLGYSLMDEPLTGAEPKGSASACNYRRQCGGLNWSSEDASSAQRRACRAMKVPGRTKR